MISRRESREAAVKIIFQNEFLDGRLMVDNPSDENIDAETMLAMYLNSAEESELERIDRKFVINIINGIISHVSELDKEIMEHTTDWSLDRMAKIDLAILRLAIYELKFADDIPSGVSINEAVELAKTFSYPQAASFINGVLGSIEKEISGGTSNV